MAERLRSGLQSRGHQFESDRGLHLQCYFFIGREKYNFDYRGILIMSEKDDWPIKQLIEGIHYYKENDFMVFTERYHLARGNCCGSSCRHCPFDHINVT